MIFSVLHGMFKKEKCQGKLQAQDTSQGILSASSLSSPGVLGTTKGLLQSIRNVFQYLTGTWFTLHFCTALFKHPSAAISSVRSGFRSSRIEAKLFLIFLLQSDTDVTSGSWWSFLLHNVVISEMCNTCRPTTFTPQLKTHQTATLHCPVKLGSLAALSHSPFSLFCSSLETRTGQFRGTNTANSPHPLRCL